MRIAKTCQSKSKCCSHCTLHIITGKNKLWSTHVKKKSKAHIKSCCGRHFLECGIFLAKKFPLVVEIHVTKSRSFIRYRFVEISRQNGCGCLALSFARIYFFKPAVTSVFVIMSSRTTRSTTLRARNLRKRPMTRSLQRRRRSRGK